MMERFFVDLTRRGVCIDRIGKSEARGGWV